MRASDGAIDSIRLSGDDFFYTTIGEKPPIGICGSGITDLMAELFLHGIVDIRGQFVENSSPHLIYKEKSAGSANKVPEGITYAPGLVFYQKDIHEFLRTKAAAYTMMAVLMEQTGITAEDISDYYMAGAFGAHFRIPLRPGSALPSLLLSVLPMNLMNLHSLQASDPPIAMHSCLLKFSSAPAFPQKKIFLHSFISSEFCL